MKSIIKLVLFFLPLFFSSQVYKDTLYDKPKYIREKIIFLTDIENVKLLSIEGDYGHDGFMTPEHARDKQLSWWFDGKWTHYVNAETFYDEKSNIVKENWFYKNDSLMRGYEYKYNNKNLKTYEKIVYTRGSFFESNYHYNGERLLGTTDKSVRKIENDSLRNARANYKHNGGILLYNDNEKKEIAFLFKRFYNNFNTIEYNFYDKSENEYNVTNYYSKKLKRGYSISKHHSDYKKILSEYRKFDNHGNVIIRKKYSEDGNVYFHEEYAYDEKNRNIKQTYFDNNKPIYYSVFKYNNEGNLMEMQHYNQEKLDFISKYFYKNYYLVKKEVTSFENNIEKFYSFELKYTFDKNNNWTEIIKSIDGKDLYIWKRDIQYY